MKFKLFLVPVLVALSVLAMSATYLNSSEDPKKEVKEGEVEQLEWHTDIHEAHQLSNASGKPIFAFFTGSDWCGWCKKLQREVFAKEAFVEWAKDNVILLELDYPRRTPQDSLTRMQNAGLQQAFQVSGYPTIWIFNTTYNDSTNNMSISALGSLGYPRGATVGKEEVLFLQNANKIVGNKPE